MLGGAAEAQVGEQKFTWPEFRKTIWRAALDETENASCDGTKVATAFVAR